MWIRIASIGLPLTFNKFDFQDFYQGFMFFLNPIGIGVVIVALFAAWLVGWSRGSRGGSRDAGNSD